jgi:hypothetical protein
MHSRTSILLSIFILFTAGSVGCNTTKSRQLRQPYVEEIMLPPENDKKFSEGPNYPEQKTNLAKIKPKDTMPVLPSMRQGAGNMSMPTGMGPQ